MRSTRHLSLLSALVLLSGAAAAQGDRGARGEAAQESERGAAGGAAEEVRAPSFVKAPVGPEATIVDEDGQSLGVVREHVIDRESGKVLFLAVGTPQAQDSHARLVAFDRLVWDAEAGRLVLPMSARELAALPEYALEVLPSILGQAPAEVADDGRDGRRSGDPARDAAAHPAPARLVSSDVLGARIVAAERPFATIGELVLDPTDGAIAFVLARPVGSAPTAGGASPRRDDPYVVPWRALAWHASEDERSFTVQVPSPRLLDAPKLDGADPARLARPVVLERIYRFYGLTPPAAEQDGEQRG